jgi:calcineurin-like phosphoesterase
MPESSSGFINKFKNYSLNIFIVLLALLTIYLLYNFLKRATTDQPEEKPLTVDTTLHSLTRQPSSETLQIDVQNGSGIQGIAGKVMEYLRANGFDVVEMGNFATSDIKTSMVIDRAGNMRNAKRVAQNLGISEKYVIQQINKNYFLDATVVVGKDYMELNPFKQNNNK